ncbi:MAG TPA: BON domain-containing protein [Nevskiaceae bacterium]|nr:BON domain-containing protein [Nevskiaceae bacterium]
MKLRNFALIAALAAAPAFIVPAYAGPVADDMSQTGHDMASDAKGAGHNIKEETKEAALTTKVKTALAKEKGLRSLKIHVDSEDGGVVTLTGKVKSTAQSEQAESATKAVEGVTTVHNNLEIKAD